MKYKDTGFRAFYRHFTAVPLKEELKAVLADFPEAETANCVLTYGYVDRDAGLTLEILAAGTECEKDYRFAEGNDSVSSKIRIGEVAEDDVAFFKDGDGSLAKKYAGKLSMLHSYDAPEEVEKTRGMAFLDESRDGTCIDDVLVYLIRDGLKTEGCWTRITGLGDYCIMGKLLIEPDQDFGYHLGEEIAFFVKETEDNKIICCSDMNPSRTITAEDLEDGSMLETAVTAFNRERTEPHLIDILEILRDSYVWVPCTAVLSEVDQERWKEIAEKLDNDPDADPGGLVGKTFRMEGETRLIPDILQNGENYFFPVFSTMEAMGEYGNHFSKVQKHMLEVIPLARNNEKDLAGIVLNAFTEPFVLGRQIWDILEKMKSRIRQP